MTDHDRIGALLCELWVRMSAIYGNRWTSQHGGTPEGIDLAEWAEAIKGLRPSQLAAGMRAVRSSGSGWPPTAPEFRAMCMDLPSLIEVQRELAGAEPVTPFGRMVWMYVDAWRYRHADAATAQRMIEQAYSLARSKVLQGEPLPEASVAIAPAPARQHVPADPETVRAYLDQIARVLR